MPKQKCQPQFLAPLGANLLSTGQPSQTPVVTSVELLRLANSLYVLQSAH